MAIIDSGNDSAGKANVDAEYNLQVALTNTPARVGSVRMMSENDSGTVTGTPYLKSPETSSDYRLRVGVDTLLFEDTFNATSQNTTLWNYVFNTMTCAQPGAGTLNFSTVQGTTSSHGAFMRTWQYFPLTNTAPMAIEFYGGMMISPLVSGEVFLAGIGLPSAAVTRPTDGVWFRLTTAGLEGILAFNGTEYTPATGVLLPFSSIILDEMAKYTIVIGESEVEFWVNDVFVGETDIPAGNAVPFLGVSAPLFMQKYNTGAVSNTNQIRVARVGATLMDIQSNRMWNTTLGTMSRSSYVGQNGQTMGSTAGNFGTTAAIPGTQGGSNTTPNAAMAGLGGLFQMTAQASSAGASGDMIAQYYLNPVSTINITGRNLVIRGVKISATNYGATVATTPTTLVWGLAYGHITNTLAATESGSFTTATAHAPRHIPLGINYVPIGAVVGQPYSSEIVGDFSEAPIVVRPGEYLSTTVRFLVGTATASQTVVYTIFFNGYFE
jgi:hypothetical protein